MYLATCNNWQGTSHSQVGHGADADGTSPSVISPDFSLVQR